MTNLLQIRDKTDANDSIANAKTSDLRYDGHRSRKNVLTKVLPFTIIPKDVRNAREAWITSGHVPPCGGAPIVPTRQRHAQRVALP